MQRVILKTRGPLDSFTIQVTRVQDETGDYLRIIARDETAVVLGLIETIDAYALANLISGLPIATTADAILAQADEPADVQEAMADARAGDDPDDILADMAEDFRPGAPRAYYPQPSRAEVEAIEADIAAADHAGFDRGYAAAVDDFRNGLWHEEVAPIWKRGFTEGLSNAIRRIDGSDPRATYDPDDAYENNGRRYAS